MIKISKITIRNFMSVGNATQGVDFDRQDLTLVLGENLDLGGDGARNGVGKTTLVNAVSYALYGQALSNIRKDNLVNRTNGKNMLVSLDFEVNGCQYRVERGRKPNVLKFYVNSEEQQVTDDSQGDSRETQSEIERVLNMTPDMFRHIVALNTYTEPFLALKANDQRNVIEQLLGITQLSEKAESLKEAMRATKEEMSQEEFRIRGQQEANVKIQQQIENLQRRQRLWITKHEEEVAALVRKIADLETLDITAELQAHRDLAARNQLVKDLQDLRALILRCEQDRARYEKQKIRLEQEISTLEQHRCPSCGQDFHDAKHEQALQQRRAELQESGLEALANEGQWIELTGAVQDLGEPGPVPKVFYDTEEAAREHHTQLVSLQQGLISKTAEQDPYTEQIQEMQEQALVEIDYDHANRLKHLQEHQDFLLKLLTSKDSFVRKKIIEQNLGYLNQRLTHYLDRIGLPHTVKFVNDLTVEITELGRELDFDNLSRGERNRLILSLSWAFRDVWESMYSPINVLFIDELIDSGMDSSGVENSLALLKKMARDRNKSVWLVSHRDELTGRVENILRVVKENGFTRFDTDVETK